MSEPPTILVQEMDDDRTLIDPIRLADPDPAFEGSGRALSSADPSPCLDEATKKPQWPWRGLRAKLSGRGRRAMEAGVVLVMVLGLGCLAYQQWRASDALRGVIAEMSAGRSAIQLQDSAGLHGRAFAPLGTEQGPATSSRDVASADREEVEHLGASLVGSNNFEDALAHYQTLADLFPNEAVFRDVIIVLKLKLKCAGPAEAASPVCL
jgi:hypothetical protein